MDYVRLRSGRQVAIRPIEPADGPNLRSAYARLSERSKYGRFLAVKPRLSDHEVRYLAQVDGTDHVALVATPIDAPAEILGVARFVRLPNDPTAAEFAIVVGDPYQRDGLATALMQRLATVAEQCGVHRFHATMLAENLAAHRLVRSMAGDIVGERHEGTVDEIDIALPR